MSTPRAEFLPDHVSEADWAEQDVVADPVTQEAGAPGSRLVDRTVVTDEVNEADLAEQMTLAYGESDEFRE